MKSMSAKPSKTPQKAGSGLVPAFATKGQHDRLIDVCAHNKYII